MRTPMNSRGFERDDSPELRMSIKDYVAQNP